MSLFTYIYFFLHIYLVTLVDFQIRQSRLLAKMLRGNSSKRQKHTILHTYQLSKKKKSEGQIGFQAFLAGRYSRGEILSYSLEDDNIQASNSDQG